MPSEASTTASSDSKTPVIEYWPFLGTARAEWFAYSVHSAYNAWVTLSRSTRPPGEESMSQAKNQSKSKNRANTTQQKTAPPKTAPAKATVQAKPAKQRNTLLTVALVLVVLHAILVLALFWFGAR